MIPVHPYMTVACPYCYAEPGDACRNVFNERVATHSSRAGSYYNLVSMRVLASIEPAHEMTEENINKWRKYHAWVLDVNPPMPLRRARMQVDAGVPPTPHIRPLYEGFQGP